MLINFYDEIKFSKTQTILLMTLTQLIGLVFARPRSVSGLSKKETCIRGRVAEMSTIVYDGCRSRKVKNLKNRPPY